MVHKFSPTYDPEFDNSETPIDQTVLGYGTYGITFIPAFNCKDSRTFPKSLGKVFFNQDNADSEFELSKVLKKIEHGTTQKYFSYPKFECHIPFPQNPISKPEQELYNFVMKHKKNIPEFVPQHVMEYSGMTLNEYINKYYPDKIPRAELIHITENLFYAVKRLQTHGYIHQDIKQNNIVISNTKRLRLIDFGLTIDKNNFVLPENNFLLRSRYYGVSPPENALFAINLADIDYNVVLGWLGGTDKYKAHYKQFESFVNEMNTNSFINFLKAHLVKTVGMLKNTLRNLLSPAELEALLNGIVANRDDIIKFAESQTKISIEKVYELYYAVQDSLSDLWEAEEFAFKSDIYSIGLVLLRLSFNKLDDSDEGIDLFKTLMGGMLAFDPRKRIGIDKAISLVKQIKAIPHKDPFKTNKDPEDISRLLKFGKEKNKVLSDLNFLLS